MKYCPLCKLEVLGNPRYCEECGGLLISAPDSAILEMETVLKDSYRILSRMGGGAMGNVYLVQDIGLEKLWALKELIPLPESEDVSQRFSSEARILSTLAHPGLPRVVDSFSERDRYYLVMDCIEGDTLEEFLSRQGKPGLAEDTVREIALQVLKVLEYLHRHDPPILYQDLKPSHIMRRASDGSIVLIDFGIAKRLHRSRHGKGRAVATEGYSPPEHYRGESEPRSDLYTLGATMHRLLSGTTPEVPFRFEPVAGISAEMQAILDKALEKSPDMRFLSSLEMAQVLEDCRVGRAAAQGRATATLPDAVQSPESSEPAPAATLVESKPTPQPTAPAADSAQSGSPSGAPSAAPSEAAGRMTPPAPPVAGAEQQQPSLRTPGPVNVFVVTGLFVFAVIVLLLTMLLTNIQVLYHAPSPQRTPTIPSDPFYGSLISPSGTGSAATTPTPVSPSPIFSLSPLPSSSATVPAAVEREIRDVIEKCTKAMEAKDLAQHMSYYADKLAIYYKKKDCPREFVYNDKLQAVQKYDTIKLYMDNIVIRMVNDVTAEVLLDKGWECKGPSLFAGKERQRLTMKKFGALWKIVGEEELTVYWVKREP